MSVSGDTAVIGAYGDDGIGSTSGSAYVFVGSGTVWTQLGKLTASDAAASDYFGWSVSVSGDTAVIGATGDDGGTGSAYVFTRSGTVWTQLGKLTASDAAAQDYFDSSVSVSGDTAVIGANYDDGIGTDSGSAYVFGSAACGWGRYLPANTWLMTAPSCQPANPPGTSINAQYGNDISGGVYGTNWIAYNWTAAQSYAQQTAADPLALGIGNWVYSTAAATLDLDGTAAPTINCTAYGLPGQCVAVDLVIPPAGANRWNMVGHPFPYTVNWADVRVAVYNGSTWTARTPSEAETAGYVSKNMHRWTGSGYNSFDDSGTPGMSGILKPHEAVWVRSLPGAAGLSGLKLLIPAQ